MSSSTEQAQRLSCAACGEVFPKRVMTGIGLGGRSMWICPDCVTGEPGEAVFAEMGGMIQRKVQRVTDAATKGERS